jgi:hypothetical protein
MSLSGAVIEILSVVLPRFPASLKQGTLVDGAYVVNSLHFTLGYPANICLSGMPNTTLFCDPN